MQTENSMYPYDFRDEDFFPTAETKRSPWRGIRNALFAFIMLSALLGGLLYQASGILPQLFGYWQDDYQLVLTEILIHNCTEGDHIRITRQEQNPSSDTVCVCGVLDAKQGKASLDLTLRQRNNAILQHIPFYGRSSGYFCEEFNLEAALPDGVYTIIARPRYSREQIAGITFVISEEAHPGA